MAQLLVPLFLSSTTNPPGLLTMGNILQRINSVFSNEHRLLIIGAAVAVLSATPISISFPVRTRKRPSFHLRSWGCSFNLSRRLSSRIPFKFSLSSLYDSLRSAARNLHRFIIRSPYDTYRTAEEEDRYWKEAERGTRELHQTDARFVGTTRARNVRVPELPPLVMYYTPALLPEYRDEHTKVQRSRKRNEERPYHLSAKNYCKWHRMVFLGSDHPTEAEALHLLHLHSTRELQKIHLISRLLPDGKVFPSRRNSNPQPFSSRYQTLWQEWLTDPSNSMAINPLEEPLRLPKKCHERVGMAGEIEPTPEHIPSHLKTWATPGKIRRRYTGSCDL